MNELNINFLSWDNMLKNVSNKNYLFPRKNAREIENNELHESNFFIDLPKALNLEIHFSSPERKCRSSFNMKNCIECY